ncbi:CLUMA_CG015704, isoform A [Clunio marinus]|uniref:CLUMA_CG015704, isoform A n=1 Tax=Clunio marinus TaxID=568069 RepID=A0A1J1INP2_9DIPT|nr:CLUMA_CG015704, isoform A [Clunio marinus]
MKTFHSHRRRLNGNIKASFRRMLIVNSYASNLVTLFGPEPRDDVECGIFLDYLLMMRFTTY